MRLMFRIKCILAKLFDRIKLNQCCFKITNKNMHNDYIRIINYHDVFKQDIGKFIKQIEYYRTNYEIIDFKIFDLFMKRQYHFNLKPGMIISFDDGYKNNYDYARAVLDKYDIKGWFFVSAGLLDYDGYMTSCEIRKLKREGHVIGSHTYSHCRFEKNDLSGKLKYEIVDSKKKLEEILKAKIDIFCWVGGEKEHYTESAAKIIKENYLYSMMTNNEIVTAGTNHYQLQRTNIDACWSIELVRFQLSGLLDKIYTKKRNYVNKLTK